MVNLEQKPAKKRNRGHNKRIGFTEEVVTKDVAENLLSQQQITVKSDAKTFRSKLESEECVSNETTIRIKKTKKRKQDDSRETETKPEPRKKIKKIKTGAVMIPDESQPTKDNSEGEKLSETGRVKSDKSKRALKRMKHQELLSLKKKKSDIDQQNKALNYLSKWKFNKEEWKFEKLIQVWLVQNLYDSSKINDKHWETLVEYLNSSQGKVRDNILKEAVKIVEDDEIELNNKAKFNRAKDIVQSLQ